MELAAGSLIGPYRITGRAGHGGMGVVWKAHDTILDRPVAIKILHANDERASEHIVREARLAARLTHPNVVTVYEARREGPSACIVMEWIAGDSLAARIVPGGLGLRAALGYAIAIARALEAAHAAGIIHRDLKPSNVMVPASGEAKLLDFGIAKTLPSLQALTGDTLTATAGVVGTAAYMSPEQVRGQPLDPRSDVFSFGSVLYELLTGRRAFDGADTFSTMSAVLTHEPAMPSHAGGERLPDAAVNIVMRCLRKDPSRRFQTAADLRAALEDLAETPRHAVPAIAVRRKPRRWLWVAVAAAAAIGIVSAWLVVSRDSPARLAPVQQITYDPGIAVTPAFSPDGKLLAYASDRAAPGNVDIWLRQVAGGSSVRLTTAPGPDWNPQFSPDGTRLLYLSGDQNIVEIPVLGGAAQAPRPVASGAGPFSVASTGAVAFVRLPQPSRSGSMFVLPASGATPEPWQPDCRSTMRPIWSPEADRLLFWGECGKTRAAFWLAPPKGGARRQIPAPADVRPLGFARAAAWFRRGGEDGVLFERALSARGLAWLRLTGELTSFAETSGRPLFAGLSTAGGLVFAEHDDAHAIWHLPPGSGEPRQIASSIGHYGVSRDGRKVVFGRLIGGKAGELVLRDLASGGEQVFASHDSISFSVGSIWPQVAPDGRQIAYRVVGQNGGHYVLDTGTGQTRRLASIEEFQLGSDWSADSRLVLGECSAPSFGICEMDAAIGRITTLTRHATDQLLYPSWSLDGQWLVFGRRRAAGQPSSIWAARVNAGRRIAPESTWVRISEPGADCQRPRFSLDGSVVYYVAGASGLRHLVRHPLNARTKAPAGEATSAVPFPMEVLVVTDGFGPYPLINVTERGLFFSTVARRGNLFLGELR